ncbi:GntR family transcriptional regulator [Rhizobium tumorigenes]|uniref:GntR family transcriptional regulator n=1 Tax=Rhizobium tumorigenes TaxID=2041385 RepID=A0AAF1KAA0_9HYPH|nr:GntR family transcriptional regulator [Rhizobium tumorigenes]WFR99307.1 GntR family transcriptional regulator [Rhizobium tumorigenes]
MSQPLAQRAYGKIIEMILSGALTPGDALQEAKLGETLDMSRTPVREAIKRIEAEGLAVQDGRFLKVRRLTVAEVEEIFFLRRVLESYCAQQAVAVPPAMLEALEVRVRRLHDEGPGEDDEQRRVDDDLHRVVAEASRSEMMVSTIADLRRRTCMFDHTHLPDRFLKSCDEHLGILAALRSGDGDRAALLMAEHITHARDAVLEKLALPPGGTGA